MKRVAIFTSALVLAASAASAESVTIVHETAGGLQAELDATIAASETLSSYADITELTITGEAEVNSTDFTSIRTNLAAILVKLDIKDAALANNRLPGKQWDADDSGCLRDMVALEEVVLPANIAGIGGASFSRCKKLRKINLNDNIKVFPNHVFKGCVALELEELPPNTTHIEQFAFYQCASLKIQSLPSTVQQIRDDAFNESNVSFSELPSSLTILGPRAFRKTNVRFSTVPAGVKALNTSVFAATQCEFSTFPSHITSIGTCVLQSVKTLPEFTIPDLANLWTKIPDGTFYVNEAVTRSFVCRAQSAPAVGKVTGSNWDETFGRTAQCVNTTMKVLASALESYQSTAPYSTMNLEVLKTAVPQPVVEMPAGHDASNVSVSFVVNGVEHDGLDEVLEGEGKLVVSFLASAHEWLHVKEIRYDSAQAYAEEETEGDEVDPDLLYQVDNVSQSLRKTIEVPVNVTPDMKPLRIAVAMADVLTGIEEAEAPAAAVNRTGDVITLSVPGATLYDLAGRKVAATTGNTLHLGGLPAGGYILRANKTVVKILK